MEKLPKDFVEVVDDDEEKRLAALAKARSKDLVRPVFTRKRQAQFIRMMARKIEELEQRVTELEKHIEMSLRG